MKFEAGETTANHTIIIIGSGHVAERAEEFTVNLVLPEETEAIGVKTATQAIVHIDIIDGMKLLSICTHITIDNITVIINAQPKLCSKWRVHESSQLCVCHTRLLCRLWDSYFAALMSYVTFLASIIACSWQRQLCSISQTIPAVVAIPGVKR